MAEPLGRAVHAGLHLAIALDNGIELVRLELQEPCSMVSSMECTSSVGERAERIRISF